MAVSDQHKIGSGFGVRSTAAEVIDGVDLTGKLAVVTGGYSGIGIETTKALTEAGAFVVVPARRPDTAAEALAGMPAVEVAPLDLPVRGAAGPAGTGVGRSRVLGPPRRYPDPVAAPPVGRRAGRARLRISDELTAKGVSPYAVDPDEAARLWALSAELTGVNALT